MVDRGEPFPVPALELPQPPAALGGDPDARRRARVADAVSRSDDLLRLIAQLCEEIAARRRRERAAEKAAASPEIPTCSSTSIEQDALTTEAIPSQAGGDVPSQEEEVGKGDGR